MKSIVIEYDVPADAATAFAFLTDFDQLRRWRSLESMGTEPAGPLQVGTRLFSKVRGPAGQMAFANEVTDLDPERRFYRDRFLTDASPSRAAGESNTRMTVRASPGTPSTRAAGSCACSGRSSGAPSARGSCKTWRSYASCCKSIDARYGYPFNSQASRCPPAQPAPR